jgi:Cu-Zn family superoxide dismutase
MIKSHAATLTLAIPLLLLVGCATVTPRAATEALGTADLRDASGTERGTAEIGRDGAGLLLTVRMVGMVPNGTHGAHLHSVGTCQAPDFVSAGPHLNPGGHQHGSNNPAGSHLGDLPNLEVGPAGSGSVTVRLVGDPATLLDQLFDADGTAVVVHAKPDDYRTEPSGNSGARIACGVLMRS